MDQQQLNTVLSEHKKWLKNNAEGKRANLSGAYLRYADLRYADLRGADISDTHIRYANLRYADLGGASTQSTYGQKILSVDNVGTFNGKVTFIPHFNKVFAGCWDGNLEEFLEKGLRMNEHNETQRKNMKLIYEFFRNNKEEGLNE